MEKSKTTAPLKSNFAEAIHAIAYRFSLAKAFDDFLTMSIAACTQNLVTGKSWFEEEYLQTMDTYKDSELRLEFPKAFGYLIEEMEERVEDSGRGNDVLGDFFEQHISNGRNGQFFTPYPVCRFMASIANTTTTKESLRILDPACGSGRMLVASRSMYGTKHHYYGIDIDRTCVKMAALNLFLNGMWQSEVMCANALSPDDFVISYRISFMPLGIFKIEDKEQSPLWHMHRNSFTRIQKPMEETVQKQFTESPSSIGSQLILF